jgi:hypothetical protein
MKEMHSINNIMCYRKRKFEKCRFSLFCVAFQGKTHAFSAKMVDGEIQAFNQFEGLLHLKRGIIVKKQGVISLCVGLRLEKNYELLNKVLIARIKSTTFGVYSFIISLSQYTKSS